MLSYLPPCVFKIRRFANSLCATPQIVAETGVAAGLDSVSLAKKAAADPLGNATGAISGAAAARRPSELLMFCPPLVWSSLSKSLDLPPQPPPEWMENTSASAAAAARGGPLDSNGSSRSSASGADPSDRMSFGSFDPVRAGLGHPEVRHMKI